VNHSGDANKMVGDTPRTDSHNWNEGHYDDPLHSMTDFSRQLERELNAANAKIKRLEEAGDKMAKEYAGKLYFDTYDELKINDWIKAKEAKP
jgi:uncharacterized protein Yka (UPF0111/DUF47 family)